MNETGLIWIGPTQTLDQIDPIGLCRLVVDWPVAETLFGFAEKVGGDF
jgi:hypothetical protein